MGQSRTVTTRSSASSHATWVATAESVGQEARTYHLPDSSIRGEQESSDREVPYELRKRSFPLGPAVQPDYTEPTGTATGVKDPAVNAQTQKTTHDELSLRRVAKLAHHHREPSRRWARSSDIRSLYTPL